MRSYIEKNQLKMYFILAFAFTWLILSPGVASSLGLLDLEFDGTVLTILGGIGSFGEEPGWRGFALPRLQNSRSPMKAALILTFFWWLWHLPTYWTLPLAMDAVDQYGFMAAFGIQFIVLLLLSILCAWVYIGSGGSVLMPVLLHASWNFWSGSFGQDAAAFMLPLLLLTAIVLSLYQKTHISEQNFYESHRL